MDCEFGLAEEALAMCPATSIMMVCRTPKFFCLQIYRGVSSLCIAHAIA